MEIGKNYILGIFDDDDVLKKAVTNVREAGVKIHEVFTPFPVHGLEKVLGYKESPLPKVAFLFGSLGGSLGFTMIAWMLGVDWPMIIGGKDYFGVPIAIPVTFELTVLLAALGMVGTFLVMRDLKPHKQPKIFDPRATDNKHVMAIDLGENTIEATKIKTLLKDSGASEVNDKTFDE